MEYYRRCNVCGDIFCYTTSDLKNNLSKYFGSYAPVDANNEVSPAVEANYEIESDNANCSIDVKLFGKFTLVKDIHS